MAQSKELSLRLKIVEERKQGFSYAELARRHAVSYNTVRTLCIRYHEGGIGGLRPKYAQCGRHIEQVHEKCYRLVRLIKHYHPLWGIPYIVARISKAFPNLPLQSVRHYQRRVRWVNNKLPDPILPKKPPQDPVFLAHDEWQVDAKERIKIDDGKQEVCFLNITDTKTNALLKVKVFPPCEDQSGTGNTNPTPHA